MPTSTPRSATPPGPPARPARLPRLTAVPSADPPYDDERSPVVPISAARPPRRPGPPPTHGAPAPSYAPESHAPGPSSPGPSSSGPSSPGPPALAPPGGNVRPFPAPRARPRPRPVAAPRPLRGEPPGDRWLRGLGQAVAEVLAGRRPPATVADRFTERAHGELVRAGRMLDSSRPPLAGPPHVQRPRDDVAEICLLVRCGTRRHALALRLERQGVQWLCTDFETA